MNDGTETKALELFLQPIDLTPVEFEKAVARFFKLAEPKPDRYEVQHRADLSGSSGRYEIDVLVTFSVLGFAFRTLVECKHHRSPIKREVVQVLHSRLQETGSQKGVIFSTTTFQRGAIEFAQAHGIALVQLADGSTTYSTRSLNRPKLEVTMPDLVGWVIGLTSRGSISIKVVEPGADWLDLNECPN